MSSSGDKIVGDYILKRNRLLGKGSFGEVYVGVHKDTGFEVAIKEQKKTSGANIKVITYEINAMKKVMEVDSPNFIKVFDVVVEKTYVYFILELCRGGNLDDYIKNNGALSGEDAKRTILLCARGMKTLWDNRIMHRDLKPENLFLTTDDPKTWRVVIADFGLAKALGETDISTTGTVLGTPAYLAPEVYDGKKEKYDRRIDIWSLGCIIYEVLTGHAAFKGKSIQQIMLKAKDPKKYVVYPYDMNPMAKDLIERCLTFDVVPDFGKKTYSNRISFEEFNDHPFIKSVIPKLKFEFHTKPYTINSKDCFCLFYPQLMRRKYNLVEIPNNVEIRKKCVLAMVFAESAVKNIEIARKENKFDLKYTYPESISLLCKSINILREVLEDMENKKLSSSTELKHFSDWLRSRIFEYISISKRIESCIDAILTKYGDFKAYELPSLFEIVFKRVFIRRVKLLAQGVQVTQPNQKLILSDKEKKKTLLECSKISVVLNFLVKSTDEKSDDANILRDYVTNLESLTKILKE